MPSESTCMLQQNNDQPIPVDQGPFLDMIQVPFWSGTGPFPSVTLKIDFRGMDVGDLVFRCHILGHGENGLMPINCALSRSS